MADRTAETCTISKARRNRRAKILIVDDHPLVRDGLIARISTQPDLEVCGEAASVNEARELIAATDPALVIVDIALKDSGGLDLVKRSRNTGPRMLVVSAYDDALYAERALRAGAQGYVNKQEMSESILDAIRAVLCGEVYLSPTMTRRLAGRLVGRQTPRHGVEGLSDRELQVFSLIGAGRTTREIAGLLHLSVHTIESHREKIRRKLDLRNGAELTKRAIHWVMESDSSRSGLVPAEQSNR